VPTATKQCHLSALKGWLPLSNPPDSEFGTVVNSSL
jgi:hypothetical protein